ncbi:MAG: antitoxin [Galactobacter sp.]|uniref:antitoxin n=1 Tax=Galactobacter sp. TaxID=2676125 RepID=UPI0025B7C944|nr:antitoxin [Galactobacter sp.]
MSFLDDAKNKIGEGANAAKDFAADHADSVKDGITKAGDFIDDKSGGKFSAGVDKAQDAASGLVDKFKK